MFCNRLNGKSQIYHKLGCKKMKKQLLLGLMIVFSVLGRSVLGEPFIVEVVGIIESVNICTVHFY